VSRLGGGERDGPEQDQQEVRHRCGRARVRGTWKRWSTPGV
jgi:hypothetical protein